MIRLVAALTALVCLGLGLRQTQASFWACDDAFISFRYAENFLHGHGLVFNVGEALEVATGGYLRANVHRVVAPTTGVDRYSVPFFLGPRLDAVVEPLALPAVLAARARGVEQDPTNPIFAEYGRKALLGWLRSHPGVARRWHADLLEDPAWDTSR